MTTPSSMVLERDAVLRERKAFVRGWITRCNDSVSPPEHRPLECHANAESYAAARYPLPKKTVARVVADPHDPSIHWTIVRGDLFDANTSATPAVYPSSARRRLWLDLQDNPTIEVEDDGTEGDS